MLSLLNIVVLLPVLAQCFILDTFFGGPPATVDTLDVNKYLGRWYQMFASQSVVTLWENGAYCVTADYEMLPSGNVSVLNSERLQSANGSLKVIHGYASPTTEPGKFVVHLETVPLGASYWVLKLGPDTFGPEGKYQYSVVSDNIRGTLFVLARDPDLFRQDYSAEVNTFLNDNGFDTFYNKPIVTYHGEDCAYNPDHH